MRVANLLVRVWPAPTLIDSHALSSTLIDSHALSSTLIDSHALSSTLIDSHALSSTLIDFELVQILVRVDKSFRYARGNIPIPD
jgi:hypothetical protein